jgi:glutamate carboxypeptidase
MLDEDTINGPGTADMKGGILVMLEALRALEQSRHKDNLGYTVVLSPDEEIGSPASAALLTQYGALADLGMTYEPALADGSLSGARKGSGNFSLVIRGKAAHAGREHHLGRNALVAAGQAIQALASLTGQREGLTINPAKIEGGGPSNIVPDLAIIRFNVRMTLPEDADWVMDQFTQIAKIVDVQDGITAELHGGFTRPPKPMAPPNARLFEMTRAAGAALGLDIRWRDTGGVCEGNNLWAAGCPNVDTLGVRGGSIHSSEEFAILSSFVERARLSAVLLLKFASGEFDAKSLRTLTP